jgi:hypothetical protein
MLWMESCYVLRVVDACYTWYELFGWVYTMSKAVLETGTHCALFLTCWVVVTGGVHRRAKPTRYYKTWGGCTATIFSVKLWVNTTEHSALCSVSAEDYPASSFHDQNPWKCHAQAPAVIGQFLPLQRFLNQEQIHFWVLFLEFVILWLYKFFFSFVVLMTKAVPMPSSWAPRVWLDLVHEKLYPK